MSTQWFIHGECSGVHHHQHIKVDKRNDVLSLNYRVNLITGEKFALFCPMTPMSNAKKYRSNI